MLAKIMTDRLAKFQGCLVGALLGDALGERFEGLHSQPIRMDTVTEYTMNLKENTKLLYTDDTAMTRAICRSLIERKAYDNHDMAKSFVQEYLSDPYRGYGAAVTTVFRKLKEENPVDETLPARDQFDGMGSYGNGAAMRISPLALYAKDYDKLIEYATQNARITHAHIRGVNGAVLQAVAVFEALHTDIPNLNVAKFADYLVDVAEQLEGKKDNTVSMTGRNENVAKSSESEFSYASKMKEMKSLLAQEKEWTAKDAYETFGNGIRAEQAVPAAIFAFLYKGRASFTESINFAISLGGDTDTIASMTGAISGAYWGLGAIPNFWKEKVEAVDEAMDFAQKLHELTKDS